MTGIDLPKDHTSPGCIVGVVTVADFTDWSSSRWFIDDGEQLALIGRDPVRLPEPPSRVSEA
ncbi:hypothetical protein MF271_22570 (plasmid) [Deinococcus sp. KNUC1210]|uniref:hypothetical protein n=1 Tax=Deinococcus sp. KNUC1210 TaxID=2917691 RepID=UPI001EEF9C83|nr:hypothetical protein [Deinococcus sp. KNUC1210]ULH18253.1 hypothetical protein MF271_22570 [Deinococcus sp. KNUC1210]